MGFDRAALLKKIAKAAATQGGNYLRDGRYRAVLSKLSLDDGYNGARCVAEFVCFKSTKMTGIVSVKTGLPVGDVEPYPVGASFSCVWLLDKHDAAFGAVKSLVYALFNLTSMPDEEFIQELDNLTQQESEHAHLNNPARGMVIDIETYRHLTKEKKVEMILPRWSHVQQNDADVERMRAWLDARSAVEVEEDAA
jgi:hypothetical protein